MASISAPEGSALSGVFCLWTCCGPAAVVLQCLQVLQSLILLSWGQRPCVLSDIHARMYRSGAAVWLALEHAWKHPCGPSQVWSPVALGSPGTRPHGQHSRRPGSIRLHHRPTVANNSSVCTGTLASSPGQVSASRSRHTSLASRLPDSPSYTPVLGPACRARSAAAWRATHACSKGGRVPSRRPGWASPGQRMQRRAAAQPAQRQACVRHCVLASREYAFCGSLRSAARGRGGGARSPARATTPRPPSPTVSCHPCRTWCPSLTVPPRDTLW